MDISKILAYINNKMEEISIEDQNRSTNAGPFGYGGPNWEPMQKLEAYTSLQTLFESIESDNKSSLEIHEDILLEFFEWFINEFGICMNKNTVDGNKNRFKIMEIE